VEHNDSDDIWGDDMGGHWSYKVELKDSDGKTIAKFDLDKEKWKPFAEKVSSKLNKKLIEGKWLKSNLVVFHITPFKLKNT